jgi:hypothetical protein
MIRKTMEGQHVMTMRPAARAKYRTLRRHGQRAHSVVA